MCQCVRAACIEESGGSFASTDIPHGDGGSGWGWSQCSVIMDMICACTARCSTRLFCCTARLCGDSFVPWRRIVQRQRARNRRDGGEEWMALLMVQVLRVTLHTRTLSPFRDARRSSLRCLLTLRGIAHLSAVCFPLMKAK